ncbi:MAG: M17 family peptidase N-terminal domain-containing protein, partial [Pseudohongiella sp.]|nr:M17 family peptidase N-terminal domain-containing protein [Pseudohongiella sp.]
MKYQVHSSKTLDKKTDCLVLAVWEKTGPADCALLDESLAALAGAVFKAGDIKGKTGETLLIPVHTHAKTERLLLVGAGDASKFDAKAYRKVIRATAQAINKTSAKSAIFTLPQLTVSDRDLSWAVTQLVMENSNSQYRYDHTKSKKADALHLKTVSLALPADANRKAVDEAIRAGECISLGMSLTRELGNLPGNICTPSYLGNKATEMAGKYKTVKVKVLNEKQMEKLGMGSLLSVGNGSKEESRLIVIEYKGAADASSKPYCLVGKGITFDTGGISLHPGLGMDEMKYDMCGAASVLGTMTAVAELGLPINVVAVIASAENMPS